MTKQQAFQVLDSAVSQMKLNRNEHNTLIKALQILAMDGVSKTADIKAVDAKPPAPPKKNEDELEMS